MKRSKKIVIEFKAICGETFRFEGDTIEQIAIAMAEKAEDTLSGLTYIDVGAEIIKHMAKELEIEANVAERIVDGIIAKAKQ